MGGPGELLSKDRSCPTRVFCFSLTSFYKGRHKRRQQVKIATRDCTEQTFPRKPKVILSADHKQAGDSGTVLYQQVVLRFAVTKKETETLQSIHRDRALSPLSLLDRHTMCDVTPSD